MAGGDGLSQAASGRASATSAAASPLAPREPRPTRAPHSRRRIVWVLAVLTLAVMTGHWLALDWLVRHSPWGSGLEAMPEPLFTRVLEPAEEAPAVVALPSPAAPAQPATPEAALVAAAPAPSASAASAPKTPAPTESAAPAPAATETAAAAVTPASAASSVNSATSAAAAVRASEPAPATAGTSPSLAAAPPASGATTAQSAPATPGASAPGAPADPFASLWPVDTRATYKLTGLFRGGPLYGSAQVQWLRQGAQYQAQVLLSILPFGSASYTSQGRVTATGLIPQAFEDARLGRKRLTRFTDKEVVLPDGRSFERPEGVQDMASQFIELGHRFRTGQAPTALGSSLTLPLVRPGAVDTWTYDIFAHELLRTPRLGELDTVRVTPRPFTNARGTLSSEIWFAPRLQYLPVRFKVSFGEEAMVDLVVETIEQR